MLCLFSCEQSIKSFQRGGVDVIRESWASHIVGEEDSVVIVRHFWKHARVASFQKDTI
jgi:hypothetical protein